MNLLDEVTFSVPFRVNHNGGNAVNVKSVYADGANPLLKLMRAKERVGNRDAARFNSLCKLAAEIYDTPVAAIEVRCGNSGISRQLFTHDPAGMLTSADINAAANATCPSAAYDLEMDFHYSMPIRNADGEKLGSICVMAPESRMSEPFNKIQLQLMAQLAGEIIEG